jgi:hypothetical protein
MCCLHVGAYLVRIIATKSLISVAFCACYAANVWHTQNFPFLTQLLFYENGMLESRSSLSLSKHCKGTEYDQLAILNDDFTVNEEKLAENVISKSSTMEVLTHDPVCRVYHGMLLPSCCSRSAELCILEVCRLNCYLPAVVMFKMQLLSPTSFFGIMTL